MATKENIVQLGELSLEVLQSSEANCYEVVDVRRDITLAEGETKGAALHNFIKKTCKVALRLANC